MHSSCGTGLAIAAKNECQDRFRPRLRELVISRRRSVCLARYAWVDVLDRVMVARIWHQREAGYQDDDV